jgi:hypothetical protein
VASPRYDWQHIRNEYITAPEAISKQRLADEYGVTRTTLSLRATKEQWDIQRDRFLARVQEQTTEKKAEAVATEGAQWDATCMDKAKALMDLVDKELAGQIVLDKLGNQVRIQRPAKDVGSAIKTAQEVGKAALGDKPNGDLSLTVSVRDYVESKS